MKDSLGSLLAIAALAAGCSSSVPNPATDQSTTTAFQSPSPGDSSAAILTVDPGCVSGSETAALGYWFAAENEPADWQFRGEIEGTLVVERIGEQALPAIAYFEAEGVRLKMTDGTDDFCDLWPQ